MLKNHIAGSIEYYNKTGTDRLANTMGVPTEGFGYSTYRINNGEMRNRGVEMTLNGNIVRTKDIGLNASATYSYNNALWSCVTAIAPVNKDIANRWRLPGDENKTNILLQQMATCHS